MIGNAGPRAGRRRVWSGTAGAGCGVAVAFEGPTDQPKCAPGGGPAPGNPGQLPSTAWRPADEGRCGPESGRCWPWLLLLLPETTDTPRKARAHTGYYRDSQANPWGQKWLRSAPVACSRVVEWQRWGPGFELPPRDSAFKHQSGQQEIRRLQYRHHGKLWKQKGTTEPNQLSWKRGADFETKTLPWLSHCPSAQTARTTNVSENQPRRIRPNKGAQHLLATSGWTALSIARPATRINGGG